MNKLAIIVFSAFVCLKIDAAQADASTHNTEERRPTQWALQTYRNDFAPSSFSMVNIAQVVNSCAFGEGENPELTCGVPVNYRSRWLRSKAPGPAANTRPDLLEVVF